MARRIFWVYIILTFSLIVFLPSPSVFAEERIEGMAVLEMAFAGEELTQEQIESLTDDIRGRAAELTNFRIMTKDGILAILQGKHIDLKTCDEKCEIEVGRKLKADMLVASRILVSEKIFYIRLKLYDVPLASIVRTADRECKKCSFDKLKQAVKDAVQDMCLGEAEKGRGALLIETKPFGASVILDGTPMGQTAEGRPLFFSGLMPGKHKLRADHPDYDPAHQDVKVAPDIMGKVVLELAPKPGKLTISTSPVKARLTIDDKEVGETPQSAFLPPGEHTLKVAVKGYKSQEKKVFLAANSFTRVTFDLETQPDKKKVQSNEAIGGPMVLIPAGEFMMGCNEAVEKNICKDDEKPYHKVYLDAYYIDKHEVTMEEYQKCVSAEKCKKLDESECDTWTGKEKITGGKRLLGVFKKDTNPVVCVSWDNTNSYCSWAGKRLPTEAEWEKAARGTDGRKYPWGKEKENCKYAVMDDGVKGCGRDSTWAVCSKPKGNSPYGLCDMAGNVREWVQDWYDEKYYQGPPTNNPQGPLSGEFRVVRGGAWRGFSWELRVSNRSRDRDSLTYNDKGFRCARSASE